MLIPTKRKIAVLVSGVNEEYQHSIVSGIIDYAKLIKYDVYVFTSFAEGIHARSHDLGETSVFGIPDLKLFDGVILLSNTIQAHDSTKKIVESISGLDIPVVDVDNKLTNGYCIEIDNEKAMRSLVEHFVDYHKCRRINFISGSPNNPEANARLKAYRDVLTEHGIPVEEERIFCGNFVREKGREAVEEFIKSDLPFPEAIVCANDTMALAAHMALVENGYRVPEDVLLCGFDNLKESQSLIPQMTTVNRPLREVGELACRIIHNAVNGVAMPQVQSLESSPVFTETCGCPRHNHKSVMEILYAQYEKAETLSGFITSANQMAQSLTENANDDNGDIVTTLLPYVSQIACDGLYICLSENWCESYDDDAEEEISLVQCGYTDVMKAVLSYENGELVSYENFPKSDIIPGTSKECEESRSFIISPIHFGGRCFGYFALSNSDFLDKSVMYHSWLMNIANYLENYRKQNMLKTMLNTLDSLYIRDQLTGLYNRRGFYRFAKQCYEQNKQCTILFYDFDNLKDINDAYGHDGGDSALKRFASVLVGVSSDDIIPSRFGGDEFVVYCSGFDEEAAARFCEMIDNKVKEYNDLSEEAYDIFLSCGTCTVGADTKLTLEECIDYADGRMYRVKYNKKIKNKK
ncbi:MAG: GGDEF domain-containing protein [Oscillospiraceae bacterium]|nr:GGDEF domain-containing protein [Oscillospiraceae bacterium]